MTEETSSPKSDRQFVWLAVAAMACLLLLALAALATAFLLGRNQPLISINNGSNNQGLPMEGSAPKFPMPPPQSVATPLPSPVAPASATRGAVQAPVSKPLPLSRMNPKAMEQEPPYYETLSPVAKVQFRVRAQPRGPENMKGPVPFRVRQYQPASDGRVAAVYAEKPASVSSPKEQEQAYSFLPDIAFTPSAAKGKDMSVELLSPRKSSVVNGLRAPKGFQFLVAEMKLSNLSAGPLSLDPDAFEVRDSDGVSYLVNPELLGAAFPRLPLEKGGVSSFQIAFLVPVDANLVALVATAPDGAEQISPLRPI